jgi:hypothetical protein
MNVADSSVFDGDLFSDEQLANSHATFRMLRDLTDAVWLPRLKMFAVARFQDVQAGPRASDTLTDPRRHQCRASTRSAIRANSSAATCNRDRDRAIASYLIPWPWGRRQPVESQRRRAVAVRRLGDQAYFRPTPLFTPEALGIAPGADVACDMCPLVPTAGPAGASSRNVA